MAWYRLYRPQTVQELSLTPVREYFEGVLQSGRYAHAYLFAGPKGTGKTSTARILARILNEPQNADLVLKHEGPLQEPTSDDPVLRQIAQGRSQVVLEQDAASHRGIDDVRSLQEQISVVPSEGLIRVVILDEVHMLTTEAFNALLKMLEEPPERVVFVLATTELHKIPPTVQSRCEILRFRQATADEVAQVLQVIAKQENISLSPAVQEQLVLAAQGSFRDAVKYFEAVVQDQQVDEVRLEQIAGGSDQGVTLLKHLAKKDLTAVSTFFQEVRQQGQDMSVLEQILFRQLQDRLHRAIERQEAPATIAHITQLLDHLVAKVGGYEPIDGIKLELACIEWCLNGHDSPGSGETKRPAGTSDLSPSKTETKKDKKPAIPHVKDEVSVIGTVSEVNQASGGSTPATSTMALTRQAVEQAWGNILLSVRAQSAALESLLRNAQLGQVDDNLIEVQFDLAFHQEKLESPKYASLFRQALHERFHPLVDFRCTVVTPIVSDTVQQQAASEDQLLQAVEAAVLALEPREHSPSPGEYGKVQ